ncbi:hypothetical protein QVD17_02985 [Tagetes erecta]|uniref:Uncharacterized protein n=1 Tax=Tagetes erecta TaxID=13708 RepID=A0AAD8L976_TARER|nr:hypothetical protein QVD17_02985 [Tagetes erecta]
MVIVARDMVVGGLVKNMMVVVDPNEHGWAGKVCGQRLELKKVFELYLKLIRSSSYITTTQFGQELG